MEYEEGCRYVAHPCYPFVYLCRCKLCYAYGSCADEERSPQPCLEVEAEEEHESYGYDGLRGQESATHLLAASCEEQSGAERQHATHEVIADAVERVALGIAERLQRPASHDEQQREDVAAAPQQQTIDDVELHHQSEEPVGSGPDDVVRVGHHVVEHEHLADDVHHLVFVRSWRYGVHHREDHVAHYHHLKELREVM